ncbi:hypothetical protein L2E82_45937 [Cichorium intybus]|uniref:Uncharacterized protein n=1 Tax=Cichorium intybus TaxID=13427 RepID=A0ACB8ZUA4_CICIN|nr:hypothetical protein L2E82_45937 [Cichorium intybus]
MGFLSNKIKRSEIKAGDHIYTYRTMYAYAHHGIFVGDNKVVHFTRDPDKSSNSNTSFASFDIKMSKTPSTTCTSYADCGFRHPESGVVLSCLDCFLQNRALYRFDYGVTKAAFCAKVRGGSCTTAISDEQDTVIHRAMYLLHKGFGNYDVFTNNCEDFALYCKTGLLIVENVGCGRSGQISTMFGVPIAAILTSPLKFVVPTPVVATVTAGMYCMTRYANDIGVRSDVVKVNVEDLVVKCGWMDNLKEESQENE